MSIEENKIQKTSRDEVISTSFTAPYNIYSLVLRDS
jgi:hypothetical protein